MTTDLNLTLEQKWEQATLANNFIFYKVMRHHPDACRRVLELLLNIHIEKIVISNEETIEVDLNSRGIRLDVYVQDSSRIFDVEMQVIDNKDLPERARYYQAAIDIDNLPPGAPYKKLKESHIIFLCLEDIFNENLPVYTFENICLEKPELKLNDRTYKHFFAIKNCAKMLKDKELKAFFKLILDNQAETDFTNKLLNYVQFTKRNNQWRFQFMVWSNSIIAYKEIAREEGLAEGRELQRQEDEKIIAKLTAEKDAEVQQLMEEIARLKQLHY